MKYMLMMNTMRAGKGVPQRAQKDLQAHIAFDDRSQPRALPIRRVRFSRSSVVAATAWPQLR